MMNLNMRKILLLATTISWLFVSCDKDDNHKLEEDPLSVWVYRAGTQLQGNSSQAIYLKNKQKVSLPSIDGMSGTAIDIQVAGNDVYVVGAAAEQKDHYFNPIKALLWKNDQVQELKVPNSKITFAKAVFIEGDDVYVAGYYMPETEGATQRGVVWKNGIPIDIGKKNIHTRLEDIFVVGEDVYVAGYENHQGGIVSKYWRNGVEKVLSKKEATTYARSIYVDNSDVYVAGYADGLGDRSVKLWKNGVPTTLIPSKTVTRGYGVTLDKGNVYVAGYQQVGSNYVPKIFKNNELLPIEHTIDRHSYAFSVQIVKDNIYVWGWEETGDNLKHLVWENGKEIEFITTYEPYLSLNSMFVVPKEFP